MDFYERVKQLAKRNKYPSLQEFIISLGLSQDSYYTLKKSGNLPRADEAIIIAQALDTTVEYLVTGIHPQPLTADETVSFILDEFESLAKKIRKNNGDSARRKF